MSCFGEVTEKLKKFHHYNKILAVLDSNDYSKIVTTVYDSLKSITTYLPRIRNETPKNSNSSDSYRSMGNNEYLDQNFTDALHYYNLALQYAPVGSKELALAYGNRSALYYKIEKYSSALIDIDLCLNVKASIPNLKPKLEKRREDCHANLWKEAIEHNNILQEFDDSRMSKEFFRVTGKHNPKFPFAKASINIAVKDGKETVVSTADLEVGEVVAVETAYVSHSVPLNKLIYCHYCSSYADNLIPCLTCSNALYCNKTCMRRAWAEYHDVECYMIDIYDLLPAWYCDWFKFVIKTWRSVGEDMDKFKEISARMDGYLNGTYKPLALDMNNVVSYILPPNMDHIKKYGKLYNTALYTSFVIHGLTGMKEGIIKAPCKKTFVDHVAKQLMYHVMHSVEFRMSGAMCSIRSLQVMGSNVESIGVFPFVSRIKNSCDPNLETVGLGNKMALVVKKPVKAGEELSFSYGGDYIIDTKDERQFCTYNIYGFCCQCEACTNNWLRFEREQTKPRQEEVKALIEQLAWAESVKSRFETVCQILNTTGEKDWYYKMVDTTFRQILRMYQCGYTRQRLSGNAENLEQSDNHANMDAIRMLVNAFSKANKRM